MEFIDQENAAGFYLVLVRLDEKIRNIAQLLINEWENDTKWDLKNQAYKAKINARWKEANLEEFTNNFQERYKNWKEKENTIDHLEKVLKNLIREIFTNDLTSIFYYGDEKIKIALLKHICQ